MKALVNIGISINIRKIGKGRKAGHLANDLVTYLRPLTAGVGSSKCHGRQWSVLPVGGLAVLTGHP